MKYLHWEVSYSETHQYTHTKLKEKNEEKHEKVEWTITPEIEEKKQYRTTLILNVYNEQILMT